jgi:hypothetical protein
LTPQGVQKLLIAKSTAELEENAGRRYTLEDLNERTGLSVDTLVRVLKCEVGVDKETLRSCFRAFTLNLEPEDYTQPQPRDDGAETQPSAGIVEPELPGGQVALDSAFYIARPPIETNCYRLISLPGALIRIKAPRQMGKTSLIARILHHAETLGYRTIALSFQLADKSVFQSLDHLLRWLCVNVTLAMKLPNQLANYWDETLGSKISSKVYFEQYLLANSAQPIVLSLDELDQVFQFPQLTEEFLGLLRAWHEAAKNSEAWKKLRLIIAYSTEVMVPVSLSQSPLNVGLAVELKPFSSQQVHDLVRRYELDWTNSQVEQITAFVKGHPYLIQIALYHIWQQEMTLEQLLQMPFNDIEIFSDSLQALAWQFQRLEDNQPQLERNLLADIAQNGSVQNSSEQNNAAQNEAGYVEELPQKSLNASTPILLDLPEGSVRLNSPFYVDRSIESRCYQALCKSGALIRIKAPRQMGKTSLMVRIVHHADKLGYQTVRLNLQQAEESTLSSLDKFLRWFSACISQRLHRPAQLDDYWDQDRGSIFNCTTYLQDHVLETLNCPLVLALDEVDRVFQSADVAQGFFSMLRIWHEEAKTVELWEQLRLIVAHSTEDYGRLDINQSPFNVGLPVELGEFVPVQVMALADVHQLSWSLTEVNQLMALVGGHPYLVRLALYYLACQDLSLDQLLSEATTNSSIYEDHLRRHLVTLNQQPELMFAFQQVVASPEPVSLSTMYVYKLYSMGLIKRQGDQVIPRCELYRQYFRDHL